MDKWTVGIHCFHQRRKQCGMNLSESKKREHIQEPAAAKAALKAHALQKATDLMGFMSAQECHVSNGKNINRSSTEVSEFQCDSAHTHKHGDLSFVYLSCHYFQ